MLMFLLPDSPSNDLSCKGLIFILSILPMILLEEPCNTVAVKIRKMRKTELFPGNKKKFSLFSPGVNKHMLEYLT